MVLEEVQWMSYFYSELEKTARRAGGQTLKTASKNLTLISRVQYKCKTERASYYNKFAYVNMLCLLLFICCKQGEN